jgi:hypothetical protein
MGWRGAASSSPGSLTEAGAHTPLRPDGSAPPTGGRVWLSAAGEKAGMAKKLSTKERKKLGRKPFALPDERKYPIPDKAHARNALARVAQDGTQKEQKEVRAAVKRRYPGIGQNK